MPDSAFGHQGSALTAASSAPAVPGEGPDVIRGVPRESPEALRILDERHARGELGRDEYLERKGVLSGSGTDA